MTPTPVLDAALRYQAAGLAVTVCYGATATGNESPKAPVYREWQKQALTPAHIRELYKPGRTVGIVCGRMGIECLDFDCGPEVFAEWCALVDSQAPGLLSKVYEEKTPRGGIHVVFRSSGTVPGNLKLATVREPKEPSGWKCIIETRGTGGQFVCAPSPGYEVIQGDLCQLEVLTPEERDVLMSCARALDQKGATEALAKAKGQSSDGPNVGDDYAAKASIPDLLREHGWKPAQEPYWTRPGKDRGVSATLFPDGQVFYVFSSNAAPLESGRAYSPLQLYTALEHGGDISAASKVLYREGFGKRQDGSNGCKPAPPGNALAVPVTWDLADLHAYQPEADQSILLGRRWLCQGQGTLWVGSSGIGKSVLAVQAAMTWALGRPFFGIVPARPLKSLIVLGEDDKGDTSEMVRGSVEGLDATGELETLRQRVIIVQECVATGGDFCRLLYLLVSAHSPALVWINPLLAFLGGDVNSQEVCSKFLRNGLNPIGIRHSCAIMVIHHTTKPSTDSKARKQWTRSDYSYIGAGSAELTNWPRAVCFLRETGDGEFRLMLCKRGQRAGIVDAEGRPVRDVNLRHGRGRLFWEAGPTDAEKAKSETAPLVQKALQEIQANRTYTREEVCKVVQDVTGRSRASVRQAGTFANTVYLAVIAELTSPECPGILRKREGGSSCPGVSSSVQPDG